MLNWLEKNEDLLALDTDATDAHGEGPELNKMNKTIKNDDAVNIFNIR